MERELRAAWDAAGRGGEIDARVQREAASQAASPPMRADRWMEIAERRETRGDKTGAVRALLEACKLDSAPHASLERARARGRGSPATTTARVAALAGDRRARGRGRARAGVQATGARARAPGRSRRGGRGLDPACWRSIPTTKRPTTPSRRSSSRAVATTSWPTIWRGARVAWMRRLGTREMLRAVRLRRAAILEQRLGRAAEACDELALLLGRVAGQRRGAPLPGRPARSPG